MIISIFLSLAFEIRSREMLPLILPSSYTTSLSSRSITTDIGAQIVAIHRYDFKYISEEDDRMKRIIDDTKLMLNLEKARTMEFICESSWQRRNSRTEEGEA